MSSMHIPELGDCLGVESCADLMPAADYSLLSSPTTFHKKRLNKIDSAVVMKPLPPRILTSLAITGNQIPFVMKKYYTDDDRLVIVEEKVKRHKYFRAHRANGRLVMTLVPMEEETDDEEDEEIKGEDEEEEINIVDEAEEGLRVEDPMLVEE